MNTFKRFAVRQLRRWQSPYPYKTQLTDLTNQPLTFKIHSENEVFRIIQYGGELDQLKTFLHALQPHDVVYDVGSSVGLWSIAAATLASNVIAFEPDPAIRNRLEQNIRLNHLKNIRAYPYAISDENGTTTLHTNGADNVSPSLGGANVKNLALGQIEVEAKTLDAFISARSTPPPTILKVDIEGAEYQALLGARKLLNSDFDKPPRLIFIEVHPQFLPQFNVSVEQIIGYITKHNYRIADEFQREDQNHYLFIHKG